MAKTKGAFIVTKPDGSRAVMGVRARIGRFEGEAVVVGRKALKSRNIQDRETKVDMTRSINKMKEDNRRAVFNSING